jgi:exodeoxyribonuclease-3
MRIATWNINGLNARLDFLLHWLDARQPDLVALQELKMEDDKVPHEALEEAGYQAVTHGQKSWNGVAVLSRSGVEVTQRGLPGQEDLGARLLEVRAGELVFTSLYCPNGKSVDHDDFPRKLAWFDALADYVAEAHSPEASLVLAGDFNICPAPEDSWNEEKLGGTIFHTDDERRRLERLSDWGLADLYRQAKPDGREFSWWDYRGGAFHRGMGLRIDLLLGTAAVVGRLEKVTIDRDYRKKKDGLTASDHAPVIAELAEGG